MAFGAAVTGFPGAVALGARGPAVGLPGGRNIGFGVGAVGFGGVVS